MEDVQRRQIEHWFSYHVPSQDKLARYELLRDKAKELALLFAENSPSCADQTAALRKLRETLMAMNLTIACN